MEKLDRAVDVSGPVVGYSSCRLQLLVKVWEAFSRVWVMGGVLLRGYFRVKKLRGFEDRYLSSMTVSLVSGEAGRFRKHRFL